MCFEKKKIQMIAKSKYSKIHNWKCMLQANKTLNVMSMVCLKSAKTNKILQKIFSCKIFCV